MKKMFSSIGQIICLFGFAFSCCSTISNKMDEAPKTHGVNEQLMITPNAMAPTDEIENEENDDIFIKDYFAPYYFKNPNHSFGNNIHGSCSYVAVDMLLSYYDSFWNDDFLPEQFDGAKTTAQGTILNAMSPGSKNESSINDEMGSSGLDYINYVKCHKNEVLHLQLISIGVDKYNVTNYSQDGKTVSLGTKLNVMRNIINDYLDDSTSLTRDSVNIGYKGLLALNKRETVIEKVKQGTPVVIHADKGIFSNEAHSFVAYDYDETKDEIYCHSGWGNASTHHISMTKLGYTGIREILYLEPKIDHQHSYNYIKYEADGTHHDACACSSMIPSHIEIENGYHYVDYPPAYKWDSLIKEKWSEKNQLCYTMSILKGNKYEAFEIKGIRDNRYQLSVQQWADVINAANPDYYVHISIDSQYWDDYYCIQGFTEPNRYIAKSSFLPRDWGFAGRYYFENELESSRVASDPTRMYTTVTQNGLTINTERLRCGYIEESYVVLSPRREDAGRAYLEMNFDVPVLSFMYRACMWSSKEYLDGTAIIQTKDINGVWTALKNIPVLSLKTKENGLTQFVETTSQGIHGLRFETTATATGDRNKGRLCLADLVFCTTSVGTLLPYMDCDYAV